jgi:hypothetical protein
MTIKKFEDIIFRKVSKNNSLLNKNKLTIRNKKFILVDFSMTNCLHPCFHN